ncbi:uncharacterized protein LOC111627116 isoform X1 [Centruroides sculpturatus]|uniref:uncharacterized protein LOC111627116 isoform X1 n=1 Tax=Centruroides sculpturatus TaxID=218467 RepID=UPI000C6CF63C|nr:uncharacterized protein LOC111627116 isoform X1 [Centruroides sculpturatus]
MMIARATLLVIIVQVMIYYGTGAESRKLQQSKTQFSAVNKLNEPKYLPHFSENVLDVSDSSNATEKLNSVSSSFNDDKNDPRYKRETFNMRTKRYHLPNIGTDIRYIKPPNNILFNKAGIDDDEDEAFYVWEDHSKPKINPLSNRPSGLRGSLAKEMLKATIDQTRALVEILEKISEIV